MPFLAFSAAIRKTIHMTNAIREPEYRGATEARNYVGLGGPASGTSPSLTEIA